MMTVFLKHLKWEFILLQKNNIISISFAVTAVYGLLLYLFRESSVMNQILTSIIVNDPAVIGFFFVALSIYTERKQNILPAIFVSPRSLHSYLLTKIISLSTIGVLCSLALTLPVKGFDFCMLEFIVGVGGLCLITTMCGIYMLTFAKEFLLFSLLSAPIFIVLICLPLLQYLGVMDVGFLKYTFPVQGSFELISFALEGTDTNYLFSISSILILTTVFYQIMCRRFERKIVCGNG